MTNILVVAAHPDDEVLGCGGAIAKHTAEGNKVDILFLADGEGARDNQADIQKRQNNALRASQALGAENPKFLNFSDNRMDQHDLLDIIQAIEGVIDQVKPETIYTHHRGDLNIDHSITHRAVMTACRPMEAQSVRRILSFEVPSSTEWQTPEMGLAFVPNWFVDISSHLEAKLEALKAYKDEMRAFPHPRSEEAIKALSKWRGASSGLLSAEAFRLERNVI
jgi:LmbE family N-acetylglucosaminyl deacetylase